MLTPNSITVSSTINRSTILAKAEKLAKNLNLPFVAHPDQCQSELLLAYTRDGLRLLDISKGIAKPKAMLHVDFVHGKSGYRLINNNTTKQPLAKAAGLKPGIRPSIFDGTAGLGGDAFVLASLGCSVMMCERSPVIGAILEDGLERARKEKLTEKIVTERTTLIIANSVKYLEITGTIFHTIYLDPMYPHSNQSALNKESMRTIRGLVGDDIDSQELLKIGLIKAANRVVVKRPRLAPYVANLKPSHEIKMKNSRFDVYLTFNQL